MKMDPQHLDAYLRGELRDDSARFLESAIQRDEALQDEVYGQARIDQALTWLLLDDPASAEDAEAESALADLETAAQAPGESPIDEMVAGVMASVSGGDERTLARSVLTELLEERDRKKRPGPWLDLAKAAAIAGLAVIGTVAVLRSVEVPDEGLRSGERRESVERARLLARITQERDAVWSESGTRQSDGEWLGAGVVTLESGVAEVTFDNGARVILEGPCTLDIQTPERAFLRRGRITVEVPPPAVGFVVNTPTMNIVDLGTRFGVAVDAGGVSELHVMEGLVEAAPTRGRSVPVLLREGFAVRADRRSQSQLQAIDYGGDRFTLRAGEGLPRPPAVVFYRFDEAIGPVLEDSGTGFEDGPFEASLFASDAGAGVVKDTPRRSVGRVGSGLIFRPGESVVSAMPSDIRADGPHTMACWVKLEPRSRPHEGVTSASASLLSLGMGSSGDTGTAGPGATTWRLRSNDRAADGPLGALRIETGDGFIIGTTDLRDGRWHHIVSRFAGSQDGGADIATHVRLFVDGRLEPIGACRHQELDDLGAGQTAGPVFLGLGVDVGSDAATASFAGTLDEVIVSREPLDPALIYRLARDPERRASLVPGL